MIIIIAGHACGNVFRKLCPMWGVKTLIRLCWSKRKDLSSFYWILLCYPSCSSKGNTVGPNKPRSKQKLIYYYCKYVELLGKPSLPEIHQLRPPTIYHRSICCVVLWAFHVPQGLIFFNSCNHTLCRHGHSSIVLADMLELDRLCGQFMPRHTLILRLQNMNSQHVGYLIRTFQYIFMFEISDSLSLALSHNYHALPAHVGSVLCVLIAST